jgi:DNA-binding response OmpR family regulator
MTLSGADLQSGSVERPAPFAGESAAAILVVDDDPAMRMLFERYLTAFGYTPLLAADGEEALRVARLTPKIRLIILDLVMTGVSGRALSEQLTAVLPEAAVIFCSGHPASELVRLGIDIKGAQFMQKPCRPLDLQQRVREMLAAG